MATSDDKVFEVLHDHYKETFEIIRYREKTRDRLFLFVVGLVGLLFIFALFPIEISGSISKMEFSIGGAKVGLSRLPLAIPASVSWSILFILSLRYCQTAVTIERQYNYLHCLEDKIAPIFGTNSIYRREGYMYKQKKPFLTYWAWIFYTMLFPLLGIVLMVFLVLAERKALPPNEFNVTYDLSVACGIFLTLFLFVMPQIVKRVQKLSKRRKSISLQ